MPDDHPPRDWFDLEVERPAGLEINHLRRAIDYTERETASLIDIYLEQRNVFSAIVGILGAKALDAFSVYEKVRHELEAQQRFPDLQHRAAGASPRPDQCLESKASKRPWSIQSHYDHEGWYVIWRYLVDPTQTIHPDRPVVIWRVDLVYLRPDDWKYEDSSAGAGRGGRTHTFGVIRPAQRLRGKAVYARPDLRLSGGKPVPA